MFLTYQLSMVGYWPTMAVAGSRELGFHSGEGARGTATASTEGSRRANYPILTQTLGRWEELCLCCACCLCVEGRDVACVCVYGWS